VGAAMPGVEEEADDVIVKGQRSFRRVQFLGIAMLFVVMAMTVALAIYFYLVFGQLRNAANRLELGAFETRRTADRQTNQVAALERGMRRTFDEFRQATASGITMAQGETIDPAPARELVAQYLRRGVTTLHDELLIARIADHPSTAPADAALFRGTLSMIAWGRSGEQVTREMTRLPDRLTEAEEAFRAALADEALKPLAHTGIAWVIYLNASSPRSSYAPADCAALHNAIEAAGPDPGPQSHFWEASCNRKLGDRLKALQGYARVLTEASPNGEPVVANLPRRDDADLTLEMNALHGVGTQLIATYNASDRIVADALAMASTRCSPGSPVRVDPMAATLSDRMVLARKCLERAIDVRRQLGQTQNERSGSQENISFAYLREGDFKGAFDNAQAVTATGYFAWNELVRALSAEKLLEGNDAKGDVRVALGEARRAVRFFRVAEFNPCELPVLLDDALFAAANQIVTEEHEGEGLTCDTARPG
jgi:hypothetical protein